MCGCRKNRGRRNPSPDSALGAATRKEYEVFVDGVSTGRRFPFMSSATHYARAVSGEIRAV